MLKASWLGVGLVLLGGVMAMAQHGDDVSLVVDAQAAKPSEYWLGIECFPVPPPLRAQLNLAEKQGLLVVGVVPDSPAAKAGMARHDVLLRAADKPLSEPRELVRAIEATKMGKLKIELLHGGKPKTVEVTPAKRPEEARRPSGEKPAPADWETMQKWLEGMWSGAETGDDGQRSPLRFRVIRPGAIVPGDLSVSVPLPPNMSIVVSKEGDQPAKIVVKRGDKKWELTEKELDKLPADVRPHVERMLGHGPLGIVGGLPSFDFMPEAAAPGEAPPALGTKPARSSGLWERMERRLDDMNGRMDKLMKAVDDLTKGQGQHQSPEDPAEK